MGGYFPLKAQPAITIKKFFGIDVTTNPLNLQPGFAVTCTNWDLSVSIDALVKRGGYEIVSGVPLGAAKDYTNIHGYISSDGDKRLFASFNFNTQFNPWDAVGYSNIWTDSIANLGSLYQFKDADGHWDTWNNILVFSNGYNVPIRWSGSNMDELFSPPPGGFNLAPVLDTPSTDQLLDGDYYYSIRASEPHDTSKRVIQDDSLYLSALSWRVHVDSGWMQLWDMPIMGTSNIPNVTDTLVWTSSFQLCRTRNGASHTDSFFLIFEFTDHDTTKSAKYTDTIPDESLGVNLFYDGGAFVGVDTGDCTGVCDSVQYRYRFIGKVDTLAINHLSVPPLADTTTDSLYRMGQPQLLDAKFIAGAGATVGVGADLDTNDIDVFRYAVCLYDSSTGMLSASGPPLRIQPHFHTDSTVSDTEFTIGLPALARNQAHLWRILYRSREVTDSLFVPDSVWRDVEYYNPKTTTRTEWFPQRGGGVPTGRQFTDQQGITWYEIEFTVSTCNYGDGLVTDNGFEQCKTGGFSRIEVEKKHLKVEPYYAVDTIKDKDAWFYVDNKEQSEVERINAIPLWGVLPPRQLDNATTWNDRFYFTNNNVVWYTQVGNPGILELSFAVNVNDGDKITALHPGEGFLDIFKNNSWYRATPSSNGNQLVHFVTKVLGGIGCISPNSVIDLPGGGMAFLHTTGIYVMGTHLSSPYKESGGVLQNISAPIQSLLDARTTAELRGVDAWLTPNNKNLCFSLSRGAGITFVYSLTGGGWSIWNLNIRNTTRYDPTYFTAQNTETMDRVYFIKGEEDSIFIFDSTDADMGDAVTAIWKSGPLAINTDYGKISDYMLWRESDSAGVLTVQIYGDSANLLRTITDSTHYRVRVLPADVKRQFFYQFYIQSAVDSLAIQRLDLWYEPTGKPEK